MNIVLFCRILYVDIETLKPELLGKPGLISAEDKNQNISLQPAYLTRDKAVLAKIKTQTQCTMVLTQRTLLI